MVKKFDFTLILFSALLLVLIATLSIFAVGGVCYADSSNGEVEDNLLNNGDFTSLDGWSTYRVNVSFTSDYGSCVFDGVGRDVYQILNFDSDYNGFINFSCGYKLLSGSVGVRFGVRLNGASSNTFYQLYSSNEPTLPYIANDVDDEFSVLSCCINLRNLDYEYVFVSFYSLVSGTSCYVDWFKVEYGDYFTGYVPRDYKNYGYNQGYERGLSDGVVQFGFKYNDRLDYTQVTNSSVSNGSYNLKDETFTLSGKTYGFGLDYIVTNYNPPLVGNNINTIGCFQDLSVDSVHYNPGLKYVSNSEIVGSILINMPWVDVTNNSSYKPLRVAFVGRNTGSVNYVNSFDSLHWHNGGLYGTMTDNSITYNIYNVSISYVTSEPVDIYFVPDNYYNFGPGVNAIYIYFPVLWSNFAVYYGVDENSLNYNSGYNAGYDNGYNSGFDVGKTVGYNYGFNKADEYYKNYGSFSFPELFGAVIDAPISVIGQALDFEVFGYNLKSFLFAILGVAIALLIIKMFI